MPKFETFTTNPDGDGDSVTVQEGRDAAGARCYIVRVRNEDGDFRMAYVSLKDMVDLANAVIDVDGDL